MSPVFVGQAPVGVPLLPVVTGGRVVGTAVVAARVVVGAAVVAGLVVAALVVVAAALVAVVEPVQLVPLSAKFVGTGLLELFQAPLKPKDVDALVARAPL